MKKLKLQSLIAVSLTINVILASLFGYLVYKKGGVSYIVEKLSKYHVKKHNNYYLTKLSLFKELPNHPSDIYIVGDSITDFGEWQELLEARNVRNRGINGDTTTGIIDRLEEITEGNPAKIFILCGINNIQSSIPASQTIKEYNIIITSFLQMKKQGKVYLQSVLPINKKIYAKKIIPKYPRIHIPTNSEVNNINQFLKEKAAKHSNIHYVNLSKLTDSSGELISEYTNDGLHLNGKGLVAWAKIIKPFVDE